MLGLCCHKPYFPDSCRTYHAYRIITRMTGVKLTLMDWGLVVQEVNPQMSKKTCMLAWYREADSWLELSYSLLGRG